MIHIKSNKEQEKLFDIDLKNRKPIYEQIIENFIELILTGKLEKDQKVPSVRELAKQLTINPNTVQKSYSELTERGFFYVSLNRGNFVADVTDELKKGQLNGLYKRLNPIALDIIKIGGTKQEIKDFIDSIDIGGQK